MTRSALPPYDPNNMNSKKYLIMLNIHKKVNHVKILGMLIKITKETRFPSNLNKCPQLKLTKTII